MYRSLVGYLLSFPVSISIQFTLKSTSLSTKNRWWVEALFNPLLMHYSNWMRFILHSTLIRLIPMQSHNKSNWNGWFKAYSYIYEHRLSFLFNGTLMRTFNVIYPLILKDFQKNSWLFPLGQTKTTLASRVVEGWRLYSPCGSNASCRQQRHFIWVLQIQTEIVCLLLNYPDKSFSLSTNFGLPS